MHLARPSTVVLPWALMAAGAVGVHGDGPQLSLRARSPEVVLGASPELEVTWANPGSQPLSLVGSVSDLIGPYSLGENFKRVIRVRRPDGSLANAGWQSAAVPSKPLQPGQTLTYRVSLTGTVEQAFNQVGAYELWAEYESPGRVYFQGQIAGQPRRYIDYWKGRVTSEPCRITITEPTGIDREAYDALAGDPMAEPRRLRTEFPASTYAAYDVWRMTGAQGLARSEPGAVIAQTSRGLWGVVRWVACPPNAGCRPGDEPSGHVPAQQALDWTARWIDIVLKAHPDIWFADDLRLRLALDEIIAGKTTLGAAALESLAKSGRPDIGAKAGELLALARQQHLVE